MLPRSQEVLGDADSGRDGMDGYRMADKILNSAPSQIFQGSARTSIRRGDPCSLLDFVFLGGVRAILRLADRMSRDLDGDLSCLDILCFRRAPS